MDILEKTKILCPFWDQTLDRPVIILTTLSWLLCKWS